MEKENENVEVKATDATEEKKDKKPNIFARAWNKTKDSVNSSILENKIEGAYRDSHKEYVLYSKESIFTPSYYGELEGNTLTIFGKPEIKPFNLIIENTKEDDSKAYFVVETKETTVKSVVEGVEYERPGTIITLDDDVTEVNVIKAGKRYFIYKGTEEK